MKKSICDQLNNCLFFSVKKLGRILDKYADESFKKTGLAPNYGFILLILNETDGLSQKEIAEKLATAPSTVARFTEKLIYMGFIRNKKQGRTIKSYITPEGKEKVKQIQDAWYELHDAYNSYIGKEYSQKLSKEINDVSDKLE